MRDTPPRRRASPEDAEKLLALTDIASSGFVRNVLGKSTPTGMTVEDFIVSRTNSADSGLSYSKLWVAEIDGSVAGFIAIDQKFEDPEPIEA